VTAARISRGRAGEAIVTLAHGAGGKATASLVESMFVPAFSVGAPAPLTDGAVLALPSGDALVLTTDSFVVSPLRFAGGSIGHLAVHGTVNDLAVMGAEPRWLSVAFVIEEGLALGVLQEIVDDIASAARDSGVVVVTGDTKVVERGAADGLYVTTAGVGLLPAGRCLDASAVRAGDRVIVSGPIGRHGVAVILARGDLALEADVTSDTAPIHGLVSALLSGAPTTRWLRDPTRGGVATVCNELARDTGLGVVLDEDAVPVDEVVRGVCDLLGIDPLYVANEGRVVAVVAEEEAGAALAALRAAPGGEAAAVIGAVAHQPTGMVVARNRFGGTRVVDLLVGDPLPRIC